MCLIKKKPNTFELKLSSKWISDATEPNAGTVQARRASRAGAVLVSAPRAVPGARASAARPVGAWPRALGSARLPGRSLSGRQDARRAQPLPCCGCARVRGGFYPPVRTGLTSGGKQLSELARLGHVSTLLHRCHGTCQQKHRGSTFFFLLHQERR